VYANPFSYLDSIDSIDSAKTLNEETAFAVKSEDNLFGSERRNKEVKAENEIRR